MDSRGCKARVYHQRLLGMVTAPKLHVRTVMLGEHGTHISRDTVIHALDLGHHQPVPNVRQFLYQVPAIIFRYNPHLGCRSCACVQRDFPRVHTNDGGDNIREISGLQGLSTASQHVRSMAHSLLGLCPEVEGKERGD